MIVGGIGVADGGNGVMVGGIGVADGGSGVMVGGIGVADGGSGVIVGGSVGSTDAPGPAAVTDTAASSAVTLATGLPDDADDAVTSSAAGDAAVGGNGVSVGAAVGATAVAARVGVRVGGPSRLRRVDVARARTAVFVGVG